MFGGHVSAQDGKSDLEHPGVITPVVHFMEISKDGSDSVGIVFRFVALLQEALHAHANMYTYIRIYIYMDVCLCIYLYPLA